MTYDGDGGLGVVCDQAYIAYIGSYMYRFSFMSFVELIERCKIKCLY